jgi:hypothetical protein
MCDDAGAIEGRRMRRSGSPQLPLNSIEALRPGATRVRATDHFAWSDDCWGKRRCMELAGAAIAPTLEVMDIDIPHLSVARVVPR